MNNKTNQMMAFNSCDAIEDHFEYCSDCLMCQSLQSDQTFQNQSWNESKSQILSTYSTNDNQMWNCLPLLPIDYMNNDFNNQLMAFPTVLSQNGFALMPQNVFNAFNEEYNESEKCGQPFISTEGTVRLNLRNALMVDISINRAIRVTNSMNGDLISVNFCGKSTAIRHRFGRIFQNENIVLFESESRIAQICENGIYFKSKNRSLSYLLDESGCKSTAIRFMNSNTNDYINHVFFDMAFNGENCYKRLSQVISDSIITSDEKGFDFWQISGVRIRQSISGDIRISKSYGRIIVWISPVNGKIKINTPLVRIKMNDNNENQYLRIVKLDKKNEIRIVAQKNELNLQYGSQKASLNLMNQICIN